MAHTLGKLTGLITLAGLLAAGCVTMRREQPIVDAAGKVIGTEITKAMKIEMPFADSKNDVGIIHKWTDADGIQHEETFTSNAETQAAAGQTAALEQAVKLLEIGVNLGKATTAIP